MSVLNNGYWPHDCEIGDILRDARGNLRTVIYLTRGKNGLPTSVSFPILRCSWTRRPYTTLNYTDLKARGFRPTGARVKRIPVLMACVAIQASKSTSDERSVYCWDTVGVIK